ncbi:hypothetical protein K435DRAFT_811700 [Dendrothele bispora CBS 962.96]|uniref:Uncharacterized protein n=1 Tax=Dendrothele bispora (strain CBS 962.96) TaxID=1314807 RepID=A0A4S8KR92_DENBC|nr:hypothetical protein K435DRAFT_811700 [Dendrothele bispora CBS 962.96]
MPSTAFLQTSTRTVPELLRVEALAAYTDRVVNGPYPWKCDQCNTSRKTCVFRGHAKKCDACASARNSCSFLDNGLKFFFHREDSAGRVVLAPSPGLLIEHVARLHYEADIMTAHNTVAVLQILSMSLNDKKLVSEYRQIDDDVRDLFDNVEFYKDLFNIVVSPFPDLNDPRFLLPLDSQMKSPKKKKKKPAKAKAKATSKKGKGKAVEPVEDKEEEEYKEEEEQEMEEEVEDTQELDQSASPAATEHVPSDDDEEDNGEDTDHTYHPPKLQSEEEEIPPTDFNEDANGDQDLQQEEEDEDKVFDQLHSSPIRPSILGFEEEAVEREDVVDEGAMQSIVDIILGRDTEEERETEEPSIEA